MNAPKAFAVLGPTAGGKTALALNIAQSLPVEIISLDSALVYRGMDIGTAKPTAEELAAVPHHLIDIISPLESYSAADFVGDCVRLVNEIHARGRYPLIVGGTMMYFHALTEGLNDLPGADTAVRAQLQAEKSEYGLTGLYRRLQEVDPITASRLKANDSQRIERALEVYLLTGKPLSEHFTEQKQAASLLDLCTVALIPEDRHLLHRQIEKRFLNMLEHGSSMKCTPYAAIIRNCIPTCRLCAAWATVRLGIISKAKPIMKPLSKKALSPRASLPNAS